MMRADPSSLATTDKAQLLATFGITLAVGVIVMKQVYTDVYSQAGQGEITELCGSLACSPAWSLESAGLLVALGIAVLVVAGVMPRYWSGD